MDYRPKCTYCRASLNKEDFHIAESPYCTVSNKEFIKQYNVIAVCNECGGKSCECPTTSYKSCEEHIKLTFPTLGERMERLKGAREFKFGTNSHLLVMLDGCNFSKYTRKLNKPFDIGFVEDMDVTCQYVAQQIPTCKMAYTQSDEISLYLTDIDTIGKNGWRDNRISKLTSLIASMASAKFMQLRLARIIEAGGSIMDMAPVYFDAKVWIVPDANDVQAWFIYRQNDCVRNSVLQFAQSIMSHKKMEGIKVDELKDILRDEYNNDWENLSDRLKYGRTFVKETRKFNLDWENISNTIIRRMWIPYDVLHKEDMNILKSGIPEEK